jgi:uncharacterized protein involved in exopolysaccharide biosynthesis
MTTDSQKPLNGSVNLIEFVLKWRRQLLMIGVSALLLSTIFSFLITPKYLSTVVMFPTQSNSISKALLDVNGTGKEDILKFGEEEEAEQMLQILNSDAIKAQVCSKYNLLEHY